jgi:hypothetical protein
MVLGRARIIISTWRSPRRVFPIHSSAPRELDRRSGPRSTSDPCSRSPGFRVILGSPFPGSAPSGFDCFRQRLQWRGPHRIRTGFPCSARVTGLTTHRRPDNTRKRRAPVAARRAKRWSGGRARARARRACDTATASCRRGLDRKDCAGSSCWDPPADAWLPRRAMTRRREAEQSRRA